MQESEIQKKLEFERLLKTGIRLKRLPLLDKNSEDYKKYICNVLDCSSMNPELYCYTQARRKDMKYNKKGRFVSQYSIYSNDNLYSSYYPTDCMILTIIKCLGKELIVADANGNLACFHAKPKLKLNDSWNFLVGKRFYWIGFVKALYGHPEIKYELYTPKGISIYKAGSVGFHLTPFFEITQADKIEIIAENASQYFLLDVIGKDINTRILGRRKNREYDI